VPINPPTPNAGAQGIVAATDITASWVASMRRLVGTVNQQAISNWSAGEVFLNRVSVQQVDDDEVNIRVQWTLGDAVTNETRGEITGISYKPFQHVREWIGIDADRDGNTLVYKPTAVLVNDVWPWGYHILLGINPPDKNA
jgi:hypothetical protein